MNTNMNMKRIGIILSLVALAIAPAAMAGTSTTVIYTGQGTIADGFGGYALVTELCGVVNGADAEGPYMLWVLTATGASNATITGPWSAIDPNTNQRIPVAMTKFGNGTFKYISGWYPPASLPGNVSATYDGKAKNAQLVISHGCRPYTHGAWCSPGFWGHATQGAWTLVGHSPTELFNSTVYDYFYGATFSGDPTLGTVLTSTGSTYKAVFAGTSGYNLNAFNATGAYLTDAIPGYHFDWDSMQSGNESDTCPIDHFGHFKTPTP